MQIPLIIGYDKFMKDLTGFHIWGTIAMNQVLNISTQLEKSNTDHKTASNMLIKNVGNDRGISAMSIADMTNIPRPTVVRKCKYLLKIGLIKINYKKQYELSNLNFKKTLVYQKEIFWLKSKFIRKVLNLLVIS